MSIYNLLWMLAWYPTKAYLKLRKRSWHLSRFESPTIHDSASNQVAWIHALSLGEVMTSIPLVTAFSNKKWTVLFSTTTKSGYQTAQAKLGQLCNEIFVLPVDAPWLTRKLCRVRPNMCIIVETDIWPNLLNTLKKNGVPVYLVNARMRPSSWKFYHLLHQMGLNMFDELDVILTASEADVPVYASCRSFFPNRVKFMGNLKWDAALLNRSDKKEIDNLKKQLRLEASRSVWIAGSIHYGEEEKILQTHKRIMSHFSDALLIVAPRKLEIVPVLTEKCHRLGLAFELKTTSNTITPKTNVFVLDTFGELSKFYGLADCAFVGGSLVPFGGHNPFEAAVYGIPVCWGPYAYNFSDATANLEASKSGKTVYSEDELFDFVMGSLQRTNIVPLPFSPEPLSISNRIFQFLTSAVNRSYEQ
ncbi:MAG: hypothetical protein JRI45_06920 [Deltaproteobacteria bacterium]|nr:hypothetical protein [Deltaproteobacteria bacterium]MBW2069134.1 hypothetical protein [Deltaproteobacteria bacterium]